jgi:tetratricopeptide (TPR) repeat protein
MNEAHNNLAYRSNQVGFAMKNKLLLFAALAVLMDVSVVRAQEMHRHDSMEKLGQVNFPVSCGAAAQKQFDRALALLHSFQYAEAGKAFSEISVSNPNCAMSSWGVAMSNYHPLWTPPTAAELEKGAAAIERARSLNAGTQRERDYIAALETFYKDADKLDHRVRARAYEQAMKKVYLRYPDDKEAAIFYALALNERALVVDEKDYTENKKKAGEILNVVLPNEPNHPGIVHYLIHSYDVPQLAYLALPAARSYAKIAPSSAHALHMPSHIFTRLGLWQESIQSNIASAAVAREKVAKSNRGWASQDQLHALDYLVYAYLQGAQDQKAKAILNQVNSLSQIDQQVFQAAFAWSAIPARYALERHRWNEAVALTLHPTAFPWARFPFAEANIHFARAIGAAQIGNTAVARQEIEKLASLQKALSEIKIGYDWATQVEIQQQTAMAWLAHAEGKNDQALRVMRSAADLEDTTEKHPVTPGALLPAREMLGDLLLEMKQPAPALKEYETVLGTSPNRFNSLYGMARAAELSGDSKKALASYRKVVALCDQSDGSRPELQKAKLYLMNK